MSHAYSSSSRCAACKCLRRKCAADCILAPHFPSSNPQRFVSVHKVFGAANITKMLEQVPVHLRARAADSMIFEAATRMRDPVYGSVGIISQLQEQIAQVQNEILNIQGEIALQNAQQQQSQAQHFLQRQEQLGATGYDGPQVGPDIGPCIGLGPDSVNGPSNVEEVGSESGQRNELEDLDDYLYAI